MVNYSYADAWIDYRKRVRLFWLTWLGGFVVMAILMWLISLVTAADWLLLAPSVLWAILSYMRRFACSNSIAPAARSASSLVRGITGLSHGLACIAAWQNGNSDPSMVAMRPNNSFKPPPLRGAA